jgi:hypothetical protein
VCEAHVETLEALVEKSLVRRRTDFDGVDRFWMLETIQEFARERLTELPRRDALVDAHADRYARLADVILAEFDANKISGAQFDRIAVEEGNLRAALETLQRRPAAERFGRLCSALFMYWYFRGDPREGARLTGEALSGDVDERTRAALENERAALLYASNGSIDEALALARSSVDRFRRLGDDMGLVYALTTLGNICGQPAFGDEAGAQAAYEEALGLARGRGAGWWERALLANLGFLHQAGGRPARARDYVARAHELAEAAGDEVFAALDNIELAGLNATLGDWAAARETAAAGIVAAHELGLARWVLTGLLAVARVEAADGSPELAARLLGAVAANAEAVGDGLHDQDARDLRDLERSLRVILGDAAVDQQSRAGAVLSLDDAVRLAVPRPGAPVAPQ